jgi:metal-sulfur cluster biosynthetic enzyme
MVTVDDVEAALTNVIDPELGLDFVELGLIYGIDVDGSVEDVTSSMVFSPPWSPDKMSEDAKFALGY